MISRKQSGFTLIEFAAVITISGLVLMAILDLYSIYIKNSMLTNTYDAFKKVDLGMAAFTGPQKRYPCPARMDIPDTDPNDGVENCGVAVPLGTCVNGICRVVGRDVDNDGTGDPVLIGAVPYQTMLQGANDRTPSNGTMTDDTAYCNNLILAGAPRPSYCQSAVIPSASSLSGLGKRDTYDSWGNRLTYVVTAKMASNTTGDFGSGSGAITIQTESGVSLSNPAGSVAWAVLSHGENGVGAYNRLGVINKPCGSGTGLDVENCDNDSTFISGIRIMAQGASYFDDMAYFTSKKLSGLWTQADEDATTGSQKAVDIVNMNIGNIGLGIQEPTQKLDVSGIIKASRGISTKICDSTGGNCFDQGTFGSATGTSCPTTPAVAAGYVRVAYAIKYGRIICTGGTIPVPDGTPDPLTPDTAHPDIAMTSAVSASSCPAGLSMRGIDNLGNIQCGRALCPVGTTPTYDGDGNITACN